MDIYKIPFSVAEWFLTMRNNNFMSGEYILGHKDVFMLTTI